MRIIEIPNEMLLPNQSAFNCSIEELNEKVYMFYRFERPQGDYNTSIGMCELDRNFQPKVSTNKELKIPRWNPKITTFDDPRAINFNEQLHLVYPSGMLVQDWAWATHISICNVQANNGFVGRPYLPEYGKNINCSSQTSDPVSACEKNWVPFVYRDKFYMVYTIDPLVVVEYDFKTGNTKEVSRYKQDLKWKYGWPSGGTPLKPTQGGYGGFFHSFTDDHPHKANVRTYHMGYLQISNTAPFGVTRISKKPLITAKPDDKKDLRKKNSPWRPNVVYPCGFIERDGKVYVSIGWQDCKCQILEFTWKEVLDGTREIAI